MKIKVGDYVFLKKECLCYKDTERFVEGFEKFYGVPVKITANAKEINSTTATDWVIENCFGIYNYDIEKIVSEETYPEYYI